MITEILIPLYIKNKNNRIYTKEALEDPVKILNLNNISFDAIPLEEDAWYNIRVQRKRKLEKLYDIQNRNNR